MRRLSRFIAWTCVASAAVIVPAHAQSLIPGSGASGPYWGLTGGGAWADVKNATKSSDLVWSGHVGYGLQISNLYLGAEADASWGGASSTSHLSPLYSSTLEVDWTATARARAGIAVGGALLYVTAGTAWSGQTVGVHSLGSTLSTTTKTVPGIVYGAGLQMKVLPFISARIEALRFDYSEQSKTFLGVIPSGLSATSWKNLDLDETVVRAGISVHFN